MDTSQRARASRRNGHSFVTKLLAKAQAITDTYAGTDNPVSVEDREGMDLIITQLSQKKRQLDYNCISDNN